MPDAQISCVMNNNDLQTNIAPTNDALTHPHACRALPMLLTAQSLSEAIRCHILRRNMLYPNNIILNCISDKVMTCIDMLSPCV